MSVWTLFAGRLTILDPSRADSCLAGRPYRPFPALLYPERFMYMPAHFEENRPEVLHRLIAEQPFGALITNGPNGLDANHVPFEFEVPSAAGETHGILRAHVARANPVWQEAAANPDALVIFQGPAAYISPNWYPSKHEAH